MLSPSLRVVLSLFGASAEAAQVALNAGYERDDEPLFPIVGRTRQAPPPSLDGQIDVFEAQPGERGSPFSFFYGYVKASSLRPLATQDREQPADVEYIDLGAAIETEAPAQPDIDRCVALLRRCTPDISRARFVVGVVDRGVSSATGPTSLGPGLTLLSPHLDYDDHALLVLGVLLEALERKGVLSECHLAMWLVGHPPPWVQSSPFQRGNMPELFRGLKAMFDLMAKHPRKGRAVNLSMGAHVGPHNGYSPIEELVDSVSTADCRLHVAAGNDGLRAVHASRQLVVGVPEDLIVQMGPGGEDWILVELWWDADCGDVSLEAALLDAHGKSVFTGSAQVSSTKNTAGGPQYAAFTDRCHDTMSCISFGLKRSPHSNLANNQLIFSLETSSHAAVHAWIVECSDPQTAFLAGGQDATFRVPSTAREALCVSGAEGATKPWRKSSRGASDTTVGNSVAPVCTQYWRTWTGAGAPHLAHQVLDATTGTSGTSIASPRAVAETIALLAATGKTLRSSDELSAELLGQRRVAWNNRTGHGILE